MVGETEEQPGHKSQLVFLKMKVRPCACVCVCVCVCVSSLSVTNTRRIHAASCVRHRLLVEVGRKWLCNHPAEIQAAACSLVSQASSHVPPIDSLLTCQRSFCIHSTTHDIVVMQSKRDPGYWETSRLLLESALCLALQAGHSSHVWSHHCHSASLVP